MARHTILTCDWCGTVIHEETNPIIAKLFLSPVVRGKARTDHGSYSASMDIGQCCTEKVLKDKKWRKRQSREDYHNGRRLRTASPVAARSRGKTGKAQ